MAALPARLPWALAQLADLSALRSSGGYALLTGESPGSAALALLDPRQPHPIRGLWLYVSPRVPHTWPLRGDLPPTA